MTMAAGRELKRPVKFIELDWDELIPALISGRVDVIISGCSYCAITPAGGLYKWTGYNPL